MAVCIHLNRVLSYTPSLCLLSIALPQTTLYLTLQRSFCGYRCKIPSDSEPSSHDEVPIAGRNTVTWRREQQHCSLWAPTAGSTKWLGWIFSQTLSLCPEWVKWHTTHDCSVYDWTCLTCITSMWKTKMLQEVVEVVLLICTEVFTFKEF